MAKSEQETTTRTTQPKRLARAKIKHPTTSDAKGRGSVAPGASRSTKARIHADAARAQAAAEAEERKKRLTKIGIAVFAAVMAIAMMVPSFSAIFSALFAGSQATPAAQQTEAATEDGTTTEADASAEATAETETPAVTVATIDSNYAAEVDTLLAKLEEDPENLAALLNLGKLYMSWGYNASYYATTSEESAHVQELFDQAITYYDRYLALNDSNAVKVDEALCHLYAGDFDTARATLEQVTQDAPDYGPAWANLGMIYEMVYYDTESATAAYEKAIEADPDDEYGAKTYASTRLASLNAEALESEDVTGTSTESTEGLSETLAEASGTGF